MSIYWLSVSLGYHEGDPLPDSFPVPRRPDSTYIWNGEEWIKSLPLVPQELHMIQAREALRIKGMLEGIDTWVEVKGKYSEIYNRWHYGSKINRSDPLMVTAANDLNLSETLLDELFILGASL